MALSQQAVAEPQPRLWLRTKLEELHHSYAPFASLESHRHAALHHGPGNFEMLKHSVPGQCPFRGFGGKSRETDVRFQDGKPAIVEVKREVRGDLATVHQKVGTMVNHPG